MPAQLQCSRSGVWEPGNEASVAVCYSQHCKIPQSSPHFQAKEPGNLPHVSS